MNRKLGYKFEHMLRAEDIENSYVPLKYDSQPVKVNEDSSSALLAMIYKRDSTNLPTGDLAYFVNPKANPEIQKFILDNLMMDVSGNASPKFPAGLDNDTAFGLMRQSGENLDDYVSRVNQFGKENSDFVYNSFKASKEVDSDASAE